MELLADNKNGNPDDSPEQTISNLSSDEEQTRTIRKLKQMFGSLGPTRKNSGGVGEHKPGDSIAPCSSTHDGVASIENLDALRYNKNNGTIPTSEICGEINCRAAPREISSGHSEHLHDY